MALHLHHQGHRMTAEWIGARDDKVGAETKEKKDNCCAEKHLVFRLILSILYTFSVLSVTWKTNETNEKNESKQTRSSRNISTSPAVVSHECRGALSYHVTQKSNCTLDEFYQHSHWSQSTDNVHSATKDVAVWAFIQHIVVCAVAFASSITDGSTEVNKTVVNVIHCVQFDFCWLSSSCLRTLKHDNVYRLCPICYAHLRLMAEIRCVGMKEKDHHSGPVIKMRYVYREEAPLRSLFFVYPQEFYRSCAINKQIRQLFCTRNADAWIWSCAVIALLFFLGGG